VNIAGPARPLKRPDCFRLICRRQSRVIVVVLLHKAENLEIVVVLLRKAENLEIVVVLLRKAENLEIVVVLLRKAENLVVERFGDPMEPTATRSPGRAVPD